MQRFKKLTAIILSMLTVSGTTVLGAATQVSASGTGAGLAEWALNAYYSDWKYVYGGSSPGAVDCSGLIWTYCGGERVDMLGASTESGSVSAGIPRVHGLGLWRPGHVGVYIGDGMEVDARGDEYDMCYESLSSSYMGWNCWFKHSAVSYVTDGWEQFNGDYYYYENGEYIVDTSRTIDGTTYYFDSTGRSGTTPSDMSSTASESVSDDTDNSAETEPEEAQTSAASESYKIGSSGEEVKNIQNRLAQLGYYKGEISGEFDEATEAAYKQFQAAAGLIVDGIAGSDREVLYSGEAPYYIEDEPATEPETVEETTVPEETEAVDESVIKLGDESETVKAIQEQLAKLGYFEIEISGLFGEYTEQAIKNFQLANGLPATGIVDEETYNALFAQQVVSNPYSEPEAEEPAVQSGPSQLPSSVSASDLIIANDANQSYSNAASAVVKKTNKVTEKALSKSSTVIPSVATAKVKRTANIWIWFVLVAFILCALSIVFFVRDKKTTRYERYKKKKRAATSNLNTRW
ncbi:MAG: peptidoglycan-binding protein [Ruminococcus sp.]|nr:peptidoglycan-binding protein [Ruminococcus sp.]